MDNESQRGEDSYLRFLIPVCLVIVTWVTYSNSFRGPFILDDIAQILQRKDTHEFSWDLFDFAKNGTLKNRRAVGDATFALNADMAEFDGRTGRPNPYGYHVVNLIIHILAGLTLFGIIRRTLLLPWFTNRYSKHAASFAGAVTLLWLLHPLQTQSVTYIVQRYESLMGLFYWLTLYCSLRSWTGGMALRIVWVIAAVAACALGMWTKAVMITAPFAVVFFDIVFMRHMIVKQPAKLLGRLPLYVLLFSTLSILVMTGLVSGVLSTEDTGPRKLRGGGIAVGKTVGFGQKDNPIGGYLSTQPYVILRYLQLTVLPVGQSLDYKDLEPSDFTAGTIVPTAIVILALLAVFLAALVRPSLLRQKSSISWAGFCGVLFFAILAPTSLVPIKDLIFEHRMYLPLAPLLVLLLAVAHGCWRSIAKDIHPALPLAIIAIVCGGMTYQRNDVYSDEEKLWLDVVEKRPRNWRAWSHLGNYYNLHTKEVAKSIGAYQKGLEVITVEEPDNLHDRASFMANLGTVYEFVGKLDEAIRAYEDAIATRGDYGVAYMNLGNALMKANRQEEALAAYRKSLELDRRETAWLNYAISLSGCGKAEEALAELEAMVQAYPKSANVRERLAKQYYRQRDYVKQEEHARAGIDLALGGSRALRNCYFQLGLSLHMRLRLDEAIPVYQKALQIDPKYLSALSNTGNCLLQMGQTDAALPYLQRAVQVDPSSANGNYFLGKALLVKRQPGDAVPYLEAALRSDPAMLHAQVLLAESYMHLNQMRLAERAIQQALQKGPQDRDVLFAQAKILLKQGQRAAGIQILERLKRYAPKFTPPQKLLELIKSGQFNPEALQGPPE